MNIVISSKNITLSEEMKDKIVAKFDRLSNFMKDDSNVRLAVEVIKETGEHHQKGKIFHVEGILRHGENMYKAGKTSETVLEACDTVKEELERQLLKIKEKRQANKRNTRKAVRAMRGKE